MDEHMGGKLTKLEVQRQRTPGRYGDGDGLWLQVSPKGGKSWLFRYQRQGRARHMGLGRVDIVSLAAARELARQARRRILEGVDPIDHRNQLLAEQRGAATTALTFKQAALAVIASREASWNREHRRQWHTTLEQHAFSTIGNLPVSNIDTTLVLRCISPIWASKEVTADRLRQRIEVILNWAAANGYRKPGNNPAKWRGHLEYLMQASNSKPQHLAALPYDQVPSFIVRLRMRQGLVGKALEFAILTACRTGEVLGASWNEINGNLWTIPAERMKTAKQHHVPLSDRALEILEGLPRERDFVFIGARTGRPL
jgi:integrase